MPQESQGAIISNKQITDLESDYYNEKDIAKSLENTNTRKKQKQKKQSKLVSFKGLSPKAVS